MDEKEIIEGLKPICQCQGIKRRAVMRHIRNGADTLKRVQRATGAGSGSCGGEQCAPRIEALLKSMGGGA